MPHHEMFEVSKEVAKVNVEEVARGGHHDVVIVPVTNALGGVGVVSDCTSK